MKRKYAALALALSASMALSPVASVSAAATEIGTPPAVTSKIYCADLSERFCLSK